MSYNTFTTYSGDGSTTDFSVPFPYLRQEDVIVTRKNGPVSFTFINPSLVRINTPLANGDILYIERRTPVDSPQVVYSNGSAFTAGNINSTVNQLLFAIQETYDRTGTVYGRSYNVTTFDELFDGSTKTFRMDSGGASLGSVVNGFGLWIVSMNGVLLEINIDFTVSTDVDNRAYITFTEAPKTGDNANLSFLRFYDGLTNADGYNVSLNDLIDVEITDPQDSDALFYDGEKWVNGTVIGGGGGSGSTSGAAILIVSNLPTTGEYDGQTVYNSTDGKLYIWNELTQEWLDIFQAFTPDAPTAVTIVTSNPAAGDYDGQVIYNKTDGILYFWDAENLVWVDMYAELTPNAPEAVGIVDSLPATGDYDGQVVFLTTDSTLYYWDDANQQWVDMYATLTSSAPASVDIVSSNPATGDFDGQTIYNSTDNKLYIWDDGSSQWLDIFQNFTPSAPDAITVVSTLPASGQTGQVVYNSSDEKLYEWDGSAWAEVVLTNDTTAEVADGAITTAKFASGLTPLEIVSALPTADNFEGRLVYLTTNNKIYRYEGAAFTAAVDGNDLTGTIDGGLLAANSIVAGTIQAGAISATEIASGAITTDKLAAGSITTAKIAAGSIGTNELDALSVTAQKIASNTITAGKIQAGAIGTTELAAAAVTTDILASNAITAGKIQAGAIGTTQLAAGAVTAQKIGAGQITSGLIQAGAIGTDQLAAGSITAQKIGTGQITSGLIQAGAIGADQIASGVITTGMIDANNFLLGTGQIANAAITNAKIGTAAVDTLQIDGEAVMVPRVWFDGSSTYGSNSTVTLKTYNFTLPYAANVLMIATGTQAYYATVPDTTFNLYLDGTLVTGVSNGGGYPNTTPVISRTQYLSAGSHSLVLQWSGASSNVWIANKSISILGIMR